MSDLDVEAVEDADTAQEDSAAPDRAPVEAPEYVLYGGKGGVGKTTMAAATALASARDGVRTLVVSTDPAHSLSDTFQTEIGSAPEQIHDEYPLWAVEIDPDAAMEDAALFAENGNLGGMGDLLGGMGDEATEGSLDDHPLLGGGMPGADEAAAFQELLRLLDDDRFDRVVVDTAPTGHTLRLLELPELMDSMVGRFLQFRQRLSGMIEGMKGMFGDAEGAESGMEDLQELSERIERLRAVLQDPSHTDFRVVMVPEEMSVVESERLVARLDEFDIPVGTLVVNRVMEDLADVTDSVPPEAEEYFVSPNLDSCAFCQRRWSVQQDALTAAHDLFRGHDVKRVPLFAEEVRGAGSLRVVAACLA